jgi:hypothetical protein
LADPSPCFMELSRSSSVYPSAWKAFSWCSRPHAARSAARLSGAAAFFDSSGCVSITSTCCGAAVDALDGGGCVQRLWCQTSTAAASTATRWQPPSARPMARPGPASCGWAATESLAALVARGGQRRRWARRGGEPRDLHLDVDDRRGGGRLLNCDAQHAAHRVEGLRLQGHRRRFDLARTPRGIYCDHRTVRITRHCRPSLTATVSAHTGEKHCSCWRKRALTASAFASYSSTVPPRGLQHQSDLLGVHDLVECAGRQRRRRPRWGRRRRRGGRRGGRRWRRWRRRRPARVGLGVVVKDHPSGARACGDVASQRVVEAGWHMAGSSLVHDEEEGHQPHSSFARQSQRSAKSQVLGP